jgi:hypothetical protein
VLQEFAGGFSQAPASVLPPIEVADRSEPLPLSFAQQRLWFLEQLGDLGSTYHIPAAVRLQGAVDGAALRQALDRILVRHEVLRTTFTLVEGVFSARSPPNFHSASSP